MPAKNATLNKTSFSRVFLIENGAGPAQVPEYEGLARMMGLDWPQGDVTPVRVPSPDAYDRFEIVDVIRGAQGLPSTTLEFRQLATISEILRKVRRECPMDIQLHVGTCKNPSDFNGGWEDGRVVVLEVAYPTGYSTGDLGALDSDQRATVLESVPFTSLDLYEIKPINPEEQATAEVTDEIVDVAICDAVSCGACGLPSDGCSVVFALAGPVAGSPGLPSELLYTEDGGANWSATNIATLGLAEAGSALACVGTNLVVVSNASNSLHYAPIADILDGTETWTEVTTGFVVSGEPNDIISLDPQHTWIVGDGGYVYFTADPTAGVTVQTAGSVTAQNLNEIHALDVDNLVAVGASNAVIVTTSGGDAWSSITGPNVGVALNTVAMHRLNEWFIGDAGGQLWYTTDGGTTWTEKTFTGSGAGAVRALAFPTPSVGYMAHNTAGPAGRILRTIDGGNSWYVLPEKSGVAMPANDYVGAIAACSEDPNIVFAGGLADDGSDGFLVKLS